MDSNVNTFFLNPANFSAKELTFICPMVQMMNNMPGMAFRCHHDPPNLSFSFVSEGCELLTGYTQNEFFDGNAIKFLDIVHPDDMPTVKKLITTTLSVGLPFESTFRIIMKDGSEKQVLMRSRVVDTDDDGLPYIIEGFYTDITKPLRVETAKLANHSKSEFLARISQEIRTPMNAVIGMTEIGLREDMPDTVRKYTHAIKQAGSKLMSVLSDIWDFTQIENGELDITSAEYSLSELLNEIVYIIAVQLEESTIEFEINIDCEIPDKLIGDAARLRQVILNILTNAVKFTDTGAVYLSIVGIVVDDTVSLRIVIEDTGRGIKEEDINNIFKEFTQFDTKNIEGTGLGLAITYNLVKLMGGEISVSSMFEVGSVFTVTLSQKIRSHEKTCSVINPKEALSKHHIRETANFTAPEARVLIVDDISANLRVAEGLLSPYKMTLDFCENGADAIEAVKSKSYDLILMDHLMPVMSGLEAALNIRSLDDAKNVPIVVLTANAGPGAKATFLQSGFDDFLAKPIDTLILNDIIKKWIPKEKQRKLSEKNAEATKETYVKIAGIDVEKGITMTGGQHENYLEILKIYYEDGRKKLNELKDCIERNDMELYQLHLHAIKGVSGSIGADDISKAAEKLELAEEQGDIDFILENHPRFLVELETLLDNIYPVVKKMR